MKRCPQCKIEKFEDEFVKNSNPRWKGDEYASWCKVCNRRRLRNHYLKNPKRAKERSRETSERWRKMSSKEKEMRLKRVREYNRKQRMVVIEKYGGECVCCGQSERKFLEIDHINNDGAKHRRDMGSSRIVMWLIKNDFPKGFQLLCSNCNMAKGRWGECPHKNNKKIT